MTSINTEPWNDTLIIIKIFLYFENFLEFPTSDIPINKVTNVKSIKRKIINSII